MLRNDKERLRRRSKKITWRTWQDEKATLQKECYLFAQSNPLQKERRSRLLQTIEQNLQTHYGEKKKGENLSLRTCQVSDLSSNKEQFVWQNETYAQGVLNCKWNVLQEGRTYPGDERSAEKSKYNRRTCHADGQGFDYGKSGKLRRCSDTSPHQEKSNQERFEEAMTMGQRQTLEVLQ